MAEFNILTESFIINTSGVGNVYDLNSSEVTDLLNQSSTLTLSGVTISLLMDLGAQKDVDRLDYSFTPVSTSGVTISYGRELSNLIPGSVSPIGQTLRVLPTTSGFDYPRYFKIQHVIPSGVPTNLTGLSVFNNDADLNFGEDGTLTSFPLVGEANAENVVYELYVKNDGVIPTDIFVSLETDGLSIETIEKFTLSPTPTGVFLNFDLDVEVPTTIPWEWGFFENMTISSDNKISVTNPSNAAALVNVGNTINLTDLGGNAAGAKIIEAKNINGNSVVVSQRTNHAFNFTNIFTNTRTVTSAPTHYTIANIQEQENLHPAWDGNDKIYYLNGQATAQVQVYTISTNTHSTALTGLSFYNRYAKTLFYDNGDLIVMGALAVPSTPSAIGNLCFRVNIQTGQETPLQNMPAAFLDKFHQFAPAPGAIYYIRGTTNSSFYRYNIATDQWDTLANIPSTGFQGGLAYNAVNNTVRTIRDDDVYEYQISIGAWNNTPLFTEMFSNVETTAILFGSSIYYEAGMSSNNTHRAKVLKVPVQLANLNTAISGSWTSPVFRVEQQENFRRILAELTNEDSIDVNFNNLAAPTFQVRGSDEPPAADNLVENFLVPLDQDRWATGVFGDVTLTSTDGLLKFSHDANGSSFTSGFILLGLPLGSSNKMQYKFWWNPGTNKLSGSTTFSALYIAPFLDVIFSGKVPVRSADTNQRTADNYVYLKLGGNSDSGGSIRSLEFYNGSSTSVFSVYAGSGSFYEVALSIDWVSGAYTVDFAGAQVGSGTIPGFRLAQLNPQHTVEIFSAAQTVDSDEKFKYFTINRVGLEPSSTTDRAFPVHRDDPLYGKNGSLEFRTTSMNSPLLPKTEYLQFRFTMSTLLAAPERTPGIASLKFPPVIKLENVGVGESKPVYFKYDFDSANTSSSLELRLKAWMFTDKT